MTPEPVTDIIEARVLAMFGDSITTDHISPGRLDQERPRRPASTCSSTRCAPSEFNSYGARRGNHEVMMRGTFANIRIKNQHGRPDIEGGVTKHFPSGEVMSIYDAAMRYQAEGRPLVVFAGKEYGTGSSRDWAAKGTKLLGVRAVIAESFERIHRSNLVGMGVLPLQFKARGLAEAGPDRRGDRHHPRPRRAVARASTLTVEVYRAVRRPHRPLPGASAASIRPTELEYFRHGGVLNYVLRNLAGAAAA